jgi:uncharacterized protein YdhG (YjbR/CyaY superfamily)
MSSTTQHFTSVDEYISTFPPVTAKVLEELREILRTELPDAEEVISYNIPAMRVHDQTIIYFAGWKNHIALYPFSDEMLTAFAEAADYRTSGKGTIQFLYSNPLPSTFIKKIISYRRKELQSNN